MGLYSVSTNPAQERSLRTPPNPDGCCDNVIQAPVHALPASTDCAAITESESESELAVVCKPDDLSSPSCVTPNVMW